MNRFEAPLIGLTVYNNDDEKYYYPADYINSIRKAGGIPVLLPPAEPEISTAIKALDGIVLTGGGDINPCHYGGGVHEEIAWVNDLQDETELIIANTALELDKPILATCRGMQLINVIFGGTLHAHLPDKYGQSIDHRTHQDTSVDHQVTITPGSQLARLLGSREFNVKSWHHQSIDQLASGFHSVAQSEDEVIEAIESEQHPDLIAVQWHPEIENDHNPVQQMLFKGWVEKCMR